MNTQPHSRVEARIQWAGRLVAAGLLVQVLSLLRVHPLSFVAFILIGCPLVAIGILVFLASLVSAES